MKKKLRGFTLIELIIAISLTLVIIGAALTFWLVNNRSLIRVDLQSTLQTEGKDIEEKLLKIGTESKEITSLISSPDNFEIINTDLSSINLDVDDKFSVNGVELKSYKDENSSRILLSGRELKLINSSGEKILSKNVKELKVKPLNLNQIVDRSSKKVKDLNGFELSMILELKKGSVTVNNPVSVIVKFRNKQDEGPEYNDEAKDIQGTITRSINKSEGVQDILGESNSDNLLEKSIGEIGQGNNYQILVKRIELKQYDGTVITLEHNEKTLKIISENKESVISQEVNEFKIIPLGIEGKDVNEIKLKKLPKFEIYMTLVKSGGANKETYPISIIVNLKSS